MENQVINIFIIISIFIYIIIRTNPDKAIFFYRDNEKFIKYFLIFYGIIAIINIII